MTYKDITQKINYKFILGICFMVSLLICALYHFAHSWMYKSSIGFCAQRNTVANVIADFN